jgi:HK97 family phage portal protein
MAGPISWIREKLTREKLNPIQPYLQSQEPLIQPDSNVDFRAAYDQVEIIHRCIEMIINSAVGIPFAVETGPGGGPVKKVNKLLNERPNPFEDKIRFLRRGLFDFLIDGNAFFYYDGNDIYILPANDIEIETDAKRFIKGYTYLLSGAGSSYDSGFEPFAGSSTGRNRSPSTGVKQETKIYFDASEVIHVKDDNEESIFRGKSRLKSLTDLINLYYALLKFQRQFFRNNAIPGVVLTTDNVMSAKVKERLLQSWRSSYTTIFEGARNPAILDGGLKIDKFSDINFQNLDFENSVERLQQDMAKALGVPYVLLKSGNNANIATNQVLFYEHTIIPIVQQFASAFEHFFNSVKVRPELRNIPALQPDLKTQAQYFTSLVNAGIITADEAREKLYFPKLEEEATANIRIPQNIAGSAISPELGGRPPEEDKTELTNE